MTPIFERGLWRETANRYWESRALIVAIVAIFVGIDILKSFAGSTSASPWAGSVWSILAINVHAAILNNSSFNQVSKTRRGVFWAFIWRSTVLAIPCGVIAAVVAFGLVGGRTYGSDSFFLVLMGVYGPVISIALGMWGTWLPAVVASGGDTSFAAATKRGKAVFSYTIFRFLLGCGAAIIGIVIIYVGAFIVGKFLGFDIDAKRGFAPYYLFVVAVSTAAIAFVFVMLPVILSRAYLIAEAGQPTGDDSRKAVEAQSQEAPIAKTAAPTGRVWSGNKRSP